MNKIYISTELDKRNIPHEFFWHRTSGPAIRTWFTVGNEKMQWNALLPLDDELDASFVEFVAENYKTLNGDDPNSKTEIILAGEINNHENGRSHESIH